MLVVRHVVYDIGVSYWREDKAEVAKNSTGRTRPTYSEEQRILAVTILLENGGMTHLGLQLAREYLGSNVSLATFHQWMNKYKDKVQKATRTLEAHRVEIIANNNNMSAVEVMESIRDRLLQQLQDYTAHNTDIVDKGSMKNVTLTIAILQDKIEKAIGMSAQMQQAIRPLAVWCNEVGLNIYDVLQDVYTAYSRLSPEQIEAYKNRSVLTDGN